MPAWVEWPKDGQLFVDVSSRLDCLFWGRVERRESNAEAMGDCQASHWVFMVLISLKCQPDLRSCTRLLYKRISLQSSDLDKISLLPVLDTKVRRSNILTEPVVVHILIMPDSAYTTLAWFWHECLMSGAWCFGTHESIILSHAVCHSEWQPTLRLWRFTLSWRVSFLLFLFSFSGDGFWVTLAKHWSFFALSLQTWRNKRETMVLVLPDWIMQ